MGDLTHAPVGGFVHAACMLTSQGDPSIPLIDTRLFVLGTYAQTVVAVGVENGRGDAENGVDPRQCDIKDKGQP
jgi:hypothetical protein